LAATVRNFWFTAFPVTSFALRLFFSSAPDRTALATIDAADGPCTMGLAGVTAGAEANEVVDDAKWTGVEAADDVADAGAV